jgi:hypothetical protein
MALGGIHWHQLSNRLIMRMPKTIPTFAAGEIIVRRTIARSVFVSKKLPFFTAENLSRPNFGLGRILPSRMLLKLNDYEH